MRWSGEQERCALSAEKQGGSGVIWRAMCRFDRLRSRQQAISAAEHVISVVGSFQRPTIGGTIPDIRGMSDYLSSSPDHYSSSSPDSYGGAGIKRDERGAG